jgi:hypothetical protein
MYKRAKGDQGRAIVSSETGNSRLHAPCSGAASASPHARELAERTAHADHATKATSGGATSRTER